MSVHNPSVFPVGEPLPELYRKFFTGQAYLNALTDRGGPISNVTFSPGCRNNWHIHHKGGQLLLVTGGKGWYQAWDEPARALRPGDVVNIPPEVKHWHGAATDSWFSHLAVEVPAEGASNEWLEPVSDEEYGSLPDAASESKVTAGRELLGGFAPQFAALNDDVLFGQVWSREEQLSPHDRSMITVAALMGAGILDSSLKGHLEKAKANGVTKEEIVEIVTQLAFYTGWPKGWAVFPMAMEVYAGEL